MVQFKSLTGNAYLRSLNLQTPWPSPEIRAVFRELLKLYSTLTQTLQRRDKPASSRDLTSLSKHFRVLCKYYENTVAENRSQSLSHAGLIDVVSRLRQNHRDCCPQGVASVLAMILHCDPRCANKDEPTNRRRPGSPHSTFPNSPGLSRLMGDIILSAICRTSLPDSCKSMRHARSIVRRSLIGRILDPSMESGQLLLAVAESWTLFVQRSLPSSSSDARRLIQAGWERLCDDLLWGVDRNPLARQAVRSSFAVACARLGIKPSHPRNLITADFTESGILESEGKFEAVINNPPWGEHLSPAEAKRLRSDFLTCRTMPDSYLAFAQKCLGLLCANGWYALALPAAALSTGKASPLRELIVGSTALRHIILVPDEVFADALTRSAVLAGSRAASPGAGRCATLNIRKVGHSITVTRSRTSQQELRRTIERGWLPTCASQTNRAGGDRSTPLKEVADIVNGLRIPEKDIVEATVGHTGVECERLFGETPPFGYIPVLDPRSIHRWSIGLVQRHLRCGTSLPGKPELASMFTGARIVVRSHVDLRSGLQATRIAFGAFPRRGVITVKPRNLDCRLLAAILNSRAAFDWMRNQACCQTRTRMWKMSVSELLDVPVPRALAQVAANESGETARPGQVVSLCRDIFEITTQITREDVSPEMCAKYQDRLDMLVDKLYKIEVGDCDCPTTLDSPL